MNLDLSEEISAGALDRAHSTKYPWEAAGLPPKQGRLERTLRQYFGLLVGVASIVGIGLVGALPAAAQEAGLPKLIKIVVPFAPAGSNDLFARALAQKLTAKLGINVIVENKAGAGGSIGADAVARAVPDGSTLLIASVSFASSAAMNPNLPFDPITSFVPVAMISKGPMILVVGNKTPYMTTAQLIAATKNPKNTINYGSSGVGSIGHMSGELFKSVSATSALHVPFQGMGPAVIAMMSGSIDYMITTMASVGGQLRAGQIRPIAVTSTERSKFFPGLPTVGESIPGYSVDVWWSILAPAKTPKSIVDRLNSEIRSVTNEPDLVKLFAQEATEPTTLTADQTASYVNAEINRWKKVARESNITVD